MKRILTVNGLLLTLSIVIGIATVVITHYRNKPNSTPISVLHDKLEVIQATKVEVEKSKALVAKQRPIKTILKSVSTSTTLNPEIVHELVNRDLAIEEYTHKLETLNEQQEDALVYAEEKLVKSERKLVFYRYTTIITATGFVILLIVLI